MMIVILLVTITSIIVVFSLQTGIRIMVMTIIVIIIMIIMILMVMYTVLTIMMVSSWRKDA